MAAKRLRHANILACGIGLPLAELEGDMNGLRFARPRWSVGR
jgi:glycine hydroxymethyltransferase